MEKSDKIHMWIELTEPAAIGFRGIDARDRQPGALEYTDRELNERLVLDQEHLQFALHLGSTDDSQSGRQCIIVTG